MIRSAPFRARIVGGAITTLVVLASIACGGSGCSGSRTEGLDRATLPEDVRADYDVFARRCSKCHSLARPLTSGITDDAQWTMYVNRMRRQPGSGISYEDQERILRFLRFYAADLRRKEAERKAPAAAPAAPPPASSAPPAAALPGDASAEGDGG